MSSDSSIEYADAGVHIDEANRTLQRIKELAAATRTKSVLGGIGGFGAMFEISGYRKPVLVSSTDGVGTKLKVAFMTGRHQTVGEDLVNHCVNDIAVQGAKPLFFMDYFATGKLQAGIAAEVVEGMARACTVNKCALTGGETAEMPGLYADGEYDLAGFIVGAVEKKRLLTGSEIRTGDVLIGLPSTGLHTNGYSLARKLLFEVAGHQPDTFLQEFGSTVADELLRVHRSYLKPLQALLKAGLLKGAAHITGGGLTDNVPRMLPEGVAAEIQSDAWPVLPVFSYLQKLGNISEQDYRRTFNLGIGIVFAVSRKNLIDAEKALNKLNEAHYTIGRVIRAQPDGSRVIYR